MENQENIIAEIWKYFDKKIIILFKNRIYHFCDRTCSIAEHLYMVWKFEIFSKNIKFTTKTFFADEY